VSTESDIAAYRHRRARERHKAASTQATALVIAQARVLLPDIIARHGDTPMVQAIRRRRLELEP
jgi:hypothetical protein